MNKEWIIGSEGRNLKFKRKTLLNYGMNRWGLNKTYSVGPTSKLIRTCAPKTFVKNGKTSISIMQNKRRKMASELQETT